MKRRPLWWVALATGCGQFDQPSSGLPRAVAAPCIADLPGTTYRCGSIVVVRDRQTGTGTVALPYIVLPANREPRRPDPILYFGGGRGRTPLADLIWLGHYQREGTDRDLIILEQRGAGYSEPAVRCASALLTPGATRACRDSLASAGVDPADFSTAAAAADYADLLGLLGIDTANLVAVEGGTSWALRFAALERGRIRSVFLDAPDPGVSDPTAVLDALDAIIAHCQRDVACARAYPQSAAQFSRLIIDLGRQPAHHQGTTIDPDALVSMLSSALRDQAKLGGIPAGIDAAARGDWVAASPLLQQGADIPEGVSMARLTAPGHDLTLDCGGSPRLGAARWSRVESNPATRPAIDRASGQEQLCRAWGVPVEPAAEIPAGVPVVLAVGGHDPVFPAASAQTVVAGLPNARLVVIPSAARGTLVQHCGRAVLRAFVADPATTTPTPCVATVSPIRFVVP